MASAKTTKTTTPTTTVTTAPTTTATTAPTTMVISTARSTGSSSKNPNLTPVVKEMVESDIRVPPYTAWERVVLFTCGFQPVYGAEEENVQTLVAQKIFGDFQFPQNGTKYILTVGSNSKTTVFANDRNQLVETLQTLMFQLVKPPESFFSNNVLITYFQEATKMTISCSLHPTMMLLVQKCEERFFMLLPQRLFKARQKSQPHKTLHYMMYRNRVVETTTAAYSNLSDIIKEKKKVEYVLRFSQDEYVDSKEQINTFSWILYRLLRAINKYPGNKQIYQKIKMPGMLPKPYDTLVSRQVRILQGQGSVEAHPRIDTNNLKTFSLQQRQLYLIAMAQYENKIPDEVVFKETLRETTALITGMDEKSMHNLVAYKELLKYTNTAFPDSTRYMKKKLSAIPSAQNASTPNLLYIFDMLTTLYPSPGSHIQGSTMDGYLMKFVILGMLMVRWNMTEGLLRELDGKTMDWANTCYFMEICSQLIKAL